MVDQEGEYPIITETTALFKVILTCLASNIDDSLMPVYSVYALKTKGLLAFPYNCDGKPGYIILTEEGELVFEDIEGSTRVVGSLNDLKSDGQRSG
ncbi:MAG: hypothetical protein RXS23_05575 [Metallosphaera yellowstonensis]|uniref:Uncharacterized protein n=1 Tax=Metallosphaera yellowstonensis MK1 TaxID=671065 RepID=H2C5F7_9CREN|nr:hypothetical protein [Metallosphaera yellowstonensis]EHP69034.1 hypothetical protein MetMK1DRAFT_00017800 [Metallosphaera yellowstonensis MK1]